MEFCNRFWYLIMKFTFKFLLPLFIFTLICSKLHSQAYIVTNNADSGANTLRWAIEMANSSIQPSTITFASDMTIYPASELPALTTNSITINGENKSIVIDGVYCDNCNGITINSSYNTIKNLKIIKFSGTGKAGILINSNKSSNLISNNYIGITSDNDPANGNYNGIYIGSNSNIIEGNNISGNLNYGIYIDKGNSNLIQGNKIGTNTAGNAGIGNEYGIYIYGTDINEGSSNTIGGNTSSARNIISGNRKSGIYINGATSNIIIGNYIGIYSPGLSSLANNEYGIYIKNGNNTMIGSTGTMAIGNTISGNGNCGIKIENSESIKIQGNFIGTNASGTSPIANGSNGIHIVKGSYIIIGTNGDYTDDSNEVNIISGNTKNGIYFDGTPGFSATTTNKIAGNKIGIASDGKSPLCNGENGISIIDYGNNIIGSNGDGISDNYEKNIIAYNTKNGIYISGTNANKNKISRNSIFENQELGIKLEDNANKNISPPKISSAVRISINTYSISGTASPGTVIELFIANSTDPVKFFPEEKDYLGGEGYIYLTTTVTDSTGKFASANVTLHNGEYVSATVTDSEGNTSQFSNCLNPSHYYFVTNNKDTGVGSLRYYLQEALSDNAKSYISFLVSNITISPSSPFPTLSEYSISDSTYYELTIDALGKGITINGSGCSTCYGFIIPTSNNKIMGLSITGFSNFPYAGILITGKNSSSNTISGNTLSGNFTGLIISDYSSGNIIGGSSPLDKNVIQNNKSDGILIMSSGGNIIKGNEIKNNNSSGIYVLNSNFSPPQISTNTIQENTISENGQAISSTRRSGIYLEGSSPFISSNTIQKNKGDGIQNTVYFGENTFSDTDSKSSYGKDIFSLPSITNNIINSNESGVSIRFVDIIPSYTTSVFSTSTFFLNNTLADNVKLQQDFFAFVKVVDKFGLPFKNAIIEVKDKNGELLVRGRTDSYGLYPSQPVPEKLDAFYSIQVTTYKDGAFQGPFTITADFGDGKIASQTFNFSANKSDLDINDTSSSDGRFQLVVIKEDEENQYGLFIEEQLINFGLVSPGSNSLPATITVKNLSKNETSNIKFFRSELISNYYSTIPSTNIQFEPSIISSIKAGTQTEFIVYVKIPYTANPGKYSGTQFIFSDSNYNNLLDSGEISDSFVITFTVPDYYKDLNILCPVPQQ